MKKSILIMGLAAVLGGSSCSDVLDLNHTLWKFISNLVMGLCNYIAGKFLIFPA